MSWLQALKRKPYRLQIILESEIQKYQEDGFEIRRLDPSVTGIWSFGDEAQARAWVEDVKLKDPDWWGQYGKYQPQFRRLFPDG